MPNKDASFVKLQWVKPHPNADKLDLAFINGWQCVVPRGKYHPDDVVFYVRPDAKLDSADDTTSWQHSYSKYLAGGNRVKTIKLRGSFSEGIVIDPQEISLVVPSVENAEKTIIDAGAGDYDAGLEKLYHISHWTNPASVCIGGNALCQGLPFGIPKSDETNVGEIPEEELPFGKMVMLTRKMDGTSCTITADVDGTTHICSRSLTLKDASEQISASVYVIATAPYVSLVRDWAVKHHERVAVRGEICGQAIQKFSINKDSVGLPTFNMYGAVFPDRPSKNDEFAYLNSQTYWPQLADELGIKKVPLLGMVEFTHELVDKYLNAPAEDGEGVVVNWEGGTFKIKSRDYYSKIG